MIISQQKRRENIVEYLLYMWQIEDLIRANQLDMDRIRQMLLNQYIQSEEEKQQMIQWYEELIDMMRSEGVTVQGHLQINKNVLITLTDLHLGLLKDSQETVYGALYYQTLPHIIQLRSKSGGTEMPELETCFTALYGYLLLRLQKKEVHAETLEGVKHIYALLYFLAEKYKEDMVSNP